MGTLLTWFYCLPIADAVVLVALAAVTFLLLDNKFGVQPWFKAAVGAAVLLWLWAVVYTTVLNRTPGTAGPHHWIPFHSYREAQSTGNTEIYRSSFMNVVLFIPAGLLIASLLPCQWPAWCKTLLPLLLLTALSTGIEYIQYAFALGRVELDDVLHNTLGALLGSMLGAFRLSPKE